MSRSPAGLSYVLHNVVVRTYSSGSLSRGFTSPFRSDTTSCGSSGCSGSSRRVCNETALHTMSRTISTRLELVALAPSQLLALIHSQKVGIEQLVAAFSYAPSRGVPCTVGNPTDSSCGLAAAL